MMVETQQISENWNMDSAMTQLIAAEDSVTTCTEKS
jgi:hypothetical protein